MTSYASSLSLFSVSLFAAIKSIYSSLWFIPRKGSKSFYIHHSSILSPYWANNFSYVLPRLHVSYWPTSSCNSIPTHLSCHLLNFFGLSADFRSMLQLSITSYHSFLFSFVSWPTSHLICSLTSYFTSSACLFIFLGHSKFNLASWVLFICLSYRCFLAFVRLQVSEFIWSLKFSVRHLTMCLVSNW